MRLLSTMVNLANESSGISDDLKGAIITALVTGIISIIGFVVTNNTMKKNFKNELKRQRDNMALEKMSAMPYEVLVLMDEMIESGKGRNETQNKRILEQNLKHFKEIMNTIYSYGSEKSIEIVSLMQKENYDANKGKFKNANNKLIDELKLKNEFKIK